MSEENDSGGDPARESANRAVANRLLLRVVCVFVLILGAYYAFAATEIYDDYVFGPYLAINTSLSTHVLVMLGEAVDTDGVRILSDHFAVSVARGCDGIEPMMLFLAALFAFPTRFVLRLPALLICLPLLAALNVVRIVSLFLIGAYRPQLFVVMHTDVWQVLYIAFALVAFGFWLAWATRSQERAQL